MQHIHCIIFAFLYYIIMQQPSYLFHTVYTNYFYLFYMLGKVNWLSRSCETELSQEAPPGTLDLLVDVSKSSC